MDAYIVSAVRTPIGKFMGALSAFTATELGSIVIKEAVSRAKIPVDAVEEVIMGCVLQAGLGQAPARQAALKAGIPNKVPALTVNKVCGSGLKAVMIAAQAIKAGDIDVAVCGGMESMSNAPYIIKDARRGMRLGNTQLIDCMVADGLWDASNNIHMGECCEVVAEKYSISREEMDEYSVESHRRAVNAIKNGYFKDEIVPVVITGRKGEKTVVEIDEGPRADTSMESLAALKAVFKEDGRLTAGNSSTINDGASAVVVASEAFVKKHGIKPLARITGYASGGVEPLMVMMAPVDALANLKRKYGVSAENVDLMEINEAFAAQVCALVKTLNLDKSKINVNGGAVALGHPIGCSGARILTTLIYALRNRKLRTGIASLCLGGGNAVALSVELAA